VNARKREYGGLCRGCKVATRNAAGDVGNRKPQKGETENRDEKKPRARRSRHRQGAFRVGTWEQATKKALLIKRNSEIPGLTVKDAKKPPRRSQNQLAKITSSLERNVKNGQLSIFEGQIDQNPSIPRQIRQKCRFLKAKSIKTRRFLGRPAKNVDF